MHAASAPPDRELAAAASDHQPAPPAASKQPMYLTRSVDFLGRRTSIVFQPPPPAGSSSSSAAGNGPCALVAICNFLLLKNVINVNPDESEVPQQKLLDLIKTCLLIKSKATDEDAPRKNKIADALRILPNLSKGLDINVKFSKIDDFEMTPEYNIFELLDIPLYHGWIVDPVVDAATAAAIGSESYDALVSGLAHFKSLSSNEESVCLEKGSLDFAGAKCDGQMKQGDLEEQEELMRVLQLSRSTTALENSNARARWILIETFLLCNAGLTCYGYQHLQGLEDGKLCVFFCNNHFNTMFKYNGLLYLLGTAEALLSQTDVVWQVFDGVNLDGPFVTSNFMRVKAEASDADSVSPLHRSCLHCTFFLRVFLQRFKVERRRIAFAEEFEQHPQTEQLVEEGPQQNISSKLIRFQPFSGSKEEKVYTLPEDLYCRLRPHQKDGLRWLWGIHCKQIRGGLVADDMGLGKTLQTTIPFPSDMLFRSDEVVEFLYGIPLNTNHPSRMPPRISSGLWARVVQAIFLSGLFHSDMIERAIIVAPLSVLHSWIDALNLSGLKRRVQEHHVSGDEGLNIVLKIGGIVLTSYEMYHSNVKKFLKKRWDYLVLDEAHKIKTVSSRIRGGLEELNCHKKILLTGTPIQRDLMDLFSLMDFIQEGILDAEDTFEKNYMDPFKCGRYLNSSFTDKEDYFRALVATLYRRLCKLYQSTLGHHSANEKILPELARHICNDPSLLLDILDGKFGDSLRDMVEKILPPSASKAPNFRTDSSCKLSFIMYLIKQLFNQDKVDKELFEEQNPEEALEGLVGLVNEDDIIQVDGMTGKEDRNKLIQNFSLQHSGPRIFLLSAKVGGEGLNLTAATRVIITDPSWNISDDNQICDRAYRYGQRDDVIVYRLFTSRTIEEHMYNIQLVKGHLTKAVLDGKFAHCWLQRRVLHIPKEGFKVSLIQQLIKRNIGDALEIDSKHQLFLEHHPCVSALTNQNLVFSETLKDLDESTDDESDAELSISPQISKANGWRQRLRKRCENNSKELTLEEADASIGSSSEFMEIPTYKVHALNRDTIKRIGQKCLARISVFPSNNSSQHSPFTAVLIGGRAKARESAKVMISDILSKENVDFVSVPSDKIGLVIGKNGDTLKKLKDDTSTMIQLIRNENKFKIIGTDEGIRDAKAKIFAIIHKVERAFQGGQATTALQTPPPPIQGPPSGSWHPTGGVNEGLAPHPGSNMVHPRPRWSQPR